MPKDRNIYFREYRKKNREKLRKYNREYNKQWRKENGYSLQLEANEKWRLKNPDKFNAKERVHYAVKVGKLKKKPCEKCGCTKVHAHHDDYNFPLLVRWLCPLHHVHEHIIKRNPNEGAM